MSALSVGAKKVALRMQALDMHDRRWLLDRLDAIQRSAVKNALRELEKMQIHPADFEGVLQQLEYEEQQSNLSEKAERFWSWVDNARIVRISNQLSPASVGVFLEGLDIQQRQRIEAALAPEYLVRVRKAAQAQRQQPSARVMQLVQEVVFDQGGQV